MSFSPLNEEIYKSTPCSAHRFANFIKEVLSERERQVYERTFLKGETCEYTAFELNCGLRTIMRDRASIIAKMRKLEAEICKIN